MPHPVVEFTDDEARLLREFGIAIFRNKVILNAQPPITDMQLAEVQEKIDGEVPPELVALWKTAFGGSLDYDYELAFGNHLYTASLRELFYPGSNHYHDLDGWIEHELEAYQEIAEDQRQPIPERAPYLPFGGYEYIERFYVSLEPEEYGSVLVYARGIPWKGRLNEDSVAFVANSAAELFDQLSLNEDPFDEKAGEYASGKEMVQRIQEVGVDHPALAEKLGKVVRASIFDWQGVIEMADFSGRLSAKESKALRLAFRFAVDRIDLRLIDQLHQKGAPFNATLHGTGGVLCYAMTKQAFGIVGRLLDLNLNLGDGAVIDAENCSDELLLRLIDYGVRFDEEAIYSAAETGAIDGAMALVKSGQVVKPNPAAQIAAIALERAASHDEDAVEIDAGNLGSYLTADEYREQARALRDFAHRVRNER